MGIVVDILNALTETLKEHFVDADVFRTYHPDGVISKMKPDDKAKIMVVLWDRASKYVSRSAIEDAVTIDVIVAKKLDTALDDAADPMIDFVSDVYDFFMEHKTFSHGEEEYVRDEFGHNNNRLIYFKDDLAKLFFTGAIQVKIKAMRERKSHE